MSLTKWTRAPDKVTRFGDMPVMLWLRPGDMRAICGEVDMQLTYAGPTYAVSIEGTANTYLATQFEDEPSPDEFQAHVLKVLEILSQTGELFGVVPPAKR